jgi:hypothetical protein
MKAEKEVPTKVKKTAARAEAKAQQPARKSRVKEKAKEAFSWARFALLAVAVVAVVILAFFYLVLPSMSNVPFTTFKDNFASAARVALIVTYGNQSQYAAESQCFPALVQTLSFTRNASTIDFFILNSTSCFYPTSGLGRASNVTTTTPASCLARAGSEPTLYLNYSAKNSTMVKAYGLYVYGNAAYMAKCPIAVDMS